MRRGESEKVSEVGLSTNLQSQGHGDRDGKEGTGDGGALEREEDEEADEEGAASNNDVALLNSTKEERCVWCGVWDVVWVACFVFVWRGVFFCVMGCFRVRTCVCKLLSGVAELPVGHV